MRVIATIVITILVCIVDSSVTPDKDLAASLEKAWDQNDFLITIMNAKPKKKSSEGKVETLLVLKYGRLGTKMVLMLDQRTKRVILENIDKDGSRSEEYTKMEISHAYSGTRNIIALVHQSKPDARMDIYINCFYQGAIPLERTFRELAAIRDNTPTEAYRQRGSAVKIYPSTSFMEVLKQQVCFDDYRRSQESGVKQSSAFENHEGSQLRSRSVEDRNSQLRGQVSDNYDSSDDYDSLDLSEQHRDSIKHRGADNHDRHSSEGSRRFSHLNDSDELDDLEDTSQFYLKRIPRRGDIGIQSLDERACLTDSQIVKTLNELIDATRKIWREIELNRMETQHARQLIENCAGCRTRFVPLTTTTTPPPSTCGYKSPCFPGADCRDTPNGPQCGACPTGYTGNGYHCMKITCAHKPCFHGVHCYDHMNGYSCGQCPRRYVGDGERCERINGCHTKPCYPNVRCESTAYPPYYRCGPCPHGFSGNGSICEDINECELAQPCYPGVRCINLRPGFRCEPCRPGYTGGTVEGIGLEAARSLTQRCEDVDECADNNGGCDPNMECINTQGSYHCGHCRHGFIGNLTVGCQPGPHICADMQTVCDDNAECFSIDNNIYSCRCQVGWAGDGFICDVDTDSDGIPDIDLQCSDRHCRKDNCPTTPNSGQEDADGDGIGDTCDPDADNDGVPSSKDNCPLIPNPGQEDTDLDGPDSVGDVCDNCPQVNNPKQEDTDGNGIGDACESDIDNDGVPNYQDNCQKVRNPDQTDSDQDKIGDACDNCPFAYNPDQKDKDCDGVGDVCDNDDDRDKDGVQDDRDNCPDVPNPDQNDIDRDGLGNECDDDMDNDGVPNNADNCPYVYNPDQRQTRHDRAGDACWDDYDNDTIINVQDNCPNNSLIWTTDFRKYTTIALDPFGTAQDDPVWKIYNDGAEIHELVNSDPGIAIGPDIFSGVDFEGTFYIEDLWDDDFVGFVFSYQSNQRFYVVAWKKGLQPYWMPSPFRAIGEPGILLKLVNSETGPGEVLRNSLWHNEDTPNQVKILWRDPNKMGWNPNTPYRWHLLHRPKIGLIRFWLYQGKQMVADSGNVYDSTLKGGKLGVYCFSQEKIIWSNLLYACRETVPLPVWNQLPDNLKREIGPDV